MTMNPHHFPILAVLLLGVPAIAQQTPTDKSATAAKLPVSDADRFEVRNVQGWTVYINRDVPKQHPAETARTLEHLRWELYQIKLAAPPEAVTNLQEHNAIWMEYDEEVDLSYHPDRSWLLERGYVLPRDPASFMSLSVKTHVGDSYRHPFVVFHEMAHGYDHYFIGGGNDYGNAESTANYQRMMKEGKYEKVEIWDNRVESHYARTNPMEYFAESTEAYFAVNDIYPFVRSEMRLHDPQMVRFIERYWGVDPKKVEKLESDLAAYLKERGSATAPAAGKPPEFVPTGRYEKRDIGGWQVRICPELVEQPGIRETMLEVLEYKLHMIDHFIAETGRKRLHEVPIWLEVGQPGPYVRYCGNREQLSAEGTNPDKAGAVEVRDPQRMMNWSMIEQGDTLRELALAYYDLHATLDDSALGKAVKAAYDQAVKSPGYQSVLRFDGSHVPHPGMANEKIYFAELMESYFLVNDHYPFIRCELKDLDPAGYAVIAGLWKGNPRR